MPFKKLVEFEENVSVIQSLCIQLTWTEARYSSPRHILFLNAYIDKENSVSQMLRNTNVTMAKFIIYQLCNCFEQTVEYVY